MSDLINRYDSGRRVFFLLILLLGNVSHMTEIIMLEGMTIVYRSNIDVYFYVLGSQLENELLLVSALNSIYDTVSLITKKTVEKRALVSNLDSIYLGKKVDFIYCHSLN
jgi:hypothetical protein